MRNPAVRIQATLGTLRATFNGEGGPSERAAGSGGSSRTLEHRGGRHHEKEGKSGPYLSASARLETGNRSEKMEEDRSKTGSFREEQTFVSGWRTTWKENTSPQRVLKATVLSLKCRKFMYKNTAVSASAPQRKQEPEQKKGTNSGEEREQKQNTVR